MISYITASARARLSKFRRIAYEASHEATAVVYSDTDSLVVNASAYRALWDYLDDTKLGALKLEHKIDFFHVLSPKYYLFRDAVTKKIETKTKGLCTTGLTTDDVIDIFRNAWGFSEPEAEKIKQTRFVRHFGYVEVGEYYKNICARRKINAIQKNGCCY